MDLEIITSASVDDTGLHLRNKDKWLSGVRALRGEIEVVARKKRATRSLSQNAYYWAVIVATLHTRLQEDGWTEDDVHEFLKTKFLPKKLAVIDGNGEVKDELVIGGTTTRLNKTEFGDYLRAVQQWAAEELDVVIPDPEGGLSR